MIKRSRMAGVLVILMCLLAGCGNSGESSAFGVSVSAKTEEGSKLRASTTGPLAKPDPGRLWFEHELRLKNVTDQTLYLPDANRRGRAEVNGSTALTVVSGPCGISTVCDKSAVGNLEVAAGATQTVTLKVYRGPVGRSGIGAGTYDVLYVVRFGATSDCCTVENARYEETTVRLRYVVSEEGAVTTSIPDS